MWVATTGEDEMPQRDQFRCASVLDVGHVSTRTRAKLGAHGLSLLHSLVFLQESG